MWVAREAIGRGQKLTALGAMAITAGTRSFVDTKQESTTPTDSANATWLSTGVAQTSKAEKAMSMITPATAIMLPVCPSAAMTARRESNP